MSTDEESPQPIPVRWDEAVAQKWIAVEEAMDVALGPFGEASLARAQARASEQVVDVGCGCGATTLALAEAVGQHGRVLGIDIAAPMLARARERVRGRAQVELVEGDAQVFQFSSEHDLVYSRFGLMFFSDPAAAFQNLALALKVGGRLAFVCWRTFEENPWLRVPFLALREIFPGAPPPPTEGPGPFGLADRARLIALLSEAGFRDVEVEALDLPVCLGADLPAAVHLSTSTGPTGRALSPLDPPRRVVARERVGATLAAALGPHGVVLPGAAWVVSAHR